MATDNEKYRYINKVGLRRGSWADERLKRDAEESHMMDQPGKLVALRLTEYYKLVDRIERMFRQNPAMAAMLLSVGGVTSEEEEQHSVPQANGKKSISTRLVSKKIPDPEEEEGDVSEEEHEGNDFVDEVNNTWEDL